MITNRPVNCVIFFVRFVGSKSILLVTCILIITLELNVIEPEEHSDVSTSNLTEESTKIQEIIRRKDTKHQISLTHRFEETFEVPSVSDVKLSDKTEKEEQDILRLDDDSDAKSRKQDENSSNQGLKDMRSSYLFGMLVSRRIRK